ncbi:MAG: DUF115 domain-containing protein [Candidatus Lokiarchaeota archaeon]|nr:DUF115 domain-containing protein [Candidatus Lokiarchaeota archaeon]
MSSSLKDKLNYYSEFKEWYCHIREEFNFDYQNDLEARDLLSRILKKKTQQWRLENILKSFRSRILLKPVILIYGCGPSLENTVNKILEKKGSRFFDEFINLTADGASVLLKEKNIQIDGIFTDLDGITKNEFNYSRFNIIHAHGDNIKKLIQFQNEIINFQNVIGTTQVEPINNVINPGGFTDGDRIIFFLRSLIKPSQKLFLIGMDFKNIVGRYSKLDIEHNQEGSQIKKKKLQFAVKLISWAKSKLKNDCFFVNSEIINNQFNYISIDNFVKILKS